MKRSKTQLLRSLAAAMLLGTAFASCSQDDMPQAGGTPLPDGEYPLTLTARVDGMNTRTAGKDEWTVGDEIGVRIGADGAIGHYRLNVSNGTGTVEEAIIPVYWQNTASSTVTAWYPYKEKQNVDISDQSEGFAEIDFLTATALEQSYKSPVSLEFKHQMAKVSYTLQAGDGVTEENLKGAAVQIAGYTKASFSEGELTGAVDGWIIPASDREALLVPQDMTGRPFIKVSIHGNDFIYTPSTETAGNLQAGSHNTYTITVKKDGIEVAGISASWNDKVNEGPAGKPVFRVYLPEQHGQTLKFSDNVETKDGYLEVTGNSFTIFCTVTDQNSMKGFPIDKGIGKMECTMSYNGYTFTYTLRSDLRLTYGDYIQVGDYFYSDGTLRPYYAVDKGCIGIVFKVGAGDGDAASNYDNKLTAIHGYVVALRDAHSEAEAWGIRDVDESGLANEDTYTSKYNGYANTEAIRELAQYNNTNISNPTANGQYWAFKAASEYNVAAPSVSSGWYLPSIGQLNDIYNLSNRANLFTNAGGTDFKTSDNGGRYWSATEKNGFDAWYYQFNGNGADAYAKSDGWLRPSYVRAVLTF